ncbi:TlpA family protein disulfide reductase [Mariniradius saccharolyticus]|nr:TlpA disulfide reductase family protein [Mariniradius saccharolyticus]
MKLFPKNGFPVLLCLCRSHPRYRKKYPNAALDMRDLLVLARFGARHPRTLLALRWLSGWLTRIPGLPVPQTAGSQPDLISAGEWISSGPAPAKRVEGFEILDFFVTFLVKQKSKAKKKHGCGDPGKTVPLQINKGRSAITRTSPRLAFLHNRSRLSWLAPTFLCLLFLNGKVAEAQTMGGGPSAPLVLYGEIIGDHYEDTLSIRVHEGYLGQSVFMPRPESYTLIPYAGDGRRGLPGTLAFSFSSKPFADFAYIHVSGAKSGVLVEHYMALPGDTVGIRLDRHANTVSFSGPHADRYRLQRELESAQGSYLLDQPAVLAVSNMERFLSRAPLEEGLPYGIKAFHPITGDSAQLNHIGRLLAADYRRHPGYEVIERYRGKVDPDFLAVMEANLYGTVMKSAVFGFNVAKKSDMGLWTGLYHSGIAGLPTGLFPPHTAYRAHHFTDFLLEKAIAGFIAGGPHPYAALKAEADPLLRDRLVTKYLVKYFERIAKREEYLLDALGYVADPQSRASLVQYRDNLSVGREAFPFVLTGIDGGEVSLASLRGKTVFVDFWFTGCQACIAYHANTLKPVESHFRGREDIVFLSVSTDKDIRRWQNSVKSGRYSSPEAVNAYTGGLGIDHPLTKHYNLHAFPSQLLIDGEGRVARVSGMQVGPGELIGILEQTINKKP